MVVPRGGIASIPDPQPAVARPGAHHVQRDAAQTHIVFGGPAVRWSDSRRHALLLVSTLLGGGMSSRLFQRVREELGLAYSVYTYQSFHADTGVHGVYVATAPESATAAADAVREELARVAAEGVPDDELEASRGQLKGQITLSLESVSSRMYRAAGVELYGEPHLALDELLARVDRITADEVSAVCREFFDPATQTILSLGPRAAAA
jgi:predicted Zn-dependent peptidase